MSYTKHIIHDPVTNSKSIVYGSNNAMFEKDMIGISNKMGEDQSIDALEFISSNKLKHSLIGIHPLTIKRVIVFLMKLAKEKELVLEIKDPDLKGVIKFIDS